MPFSMKQVRSFLGHAGFCRRFIKDFSKVACPLTNLLIKDAPFVIDESCVQAFEKLRSLLVSAPIVQPPDFSLPFEIMCDASDFAIRAILGQSVNGMPHVIYNASRTLTDAQKSYSTTEKELLAVVFALDKFHPYLLCSKVIVFTDCAALIHLLDKNDTKPRLIRWILLLQEFDIEIKDRKGSENSIGDHLSRIFTEYVDESVGFSDHFLDEQLFAVSPAPLPWFAYIMNYLVTRKIPPCWSK